MQYLVFASNGCHLAVEAARVSEICLLPAFQLVPARIPALEGILKVRGRALPLFSFASLLQQGASPLQPFQHVIIVDAGWREIALRVDQALQLQDLDPEQVTPAGELSGSLSRFSGLVQMESGVVLIQDPEALVNEAERQQLEQVLATEMQTEEAAKA